MEIISTIASLVAVLTAVKEAVDAVTGVVQSVDNFVVTFRKTVDDFKNTVTEVVVIFDSDGDGENDREEVVYRIYQTLPDYETGFCICNKGNEIGLGLPMFEIIDGCELSELLLEAPSVPLAGLPAFPDTSDGSDFPELPDISDIIDIEPSFEHKDYPIITGNDKYFIADLHNDGYNDIFSPAGDITGDGINDWKVIVDYDDNGLPDASPNQPFYPVGSDEFEYLIESIGQGDNGIMTKEIDKYSVSEALLSLILLFSVINFIRGLFRRSDYLR